MNAKTTRVLEQTALCGLGAALAYAVAHLADLDFGRWTPVLTVALTALAAAVRKWAGTDPS